MEWIGIQRKATALVVLCRHAYERISHTPHNIRGRIRSNRRSMSHAYKPARYRNLAALSRAISGRSCQTPILPGRQAAWVKWMSPARMPPIARRRSAVVTAGETPLRRVGSHELAMFPLQCQT